MMISHPMIIRAVEICRRISALTAAVVLAVHAAKGAEPEKAPTVITLMSDGRILLDGKTVSMDRLEAALRAAGIPPRPLTLRADEKVPYSNVTRVFEILSEHHPSGLDAPGPGYREQRQRALR